VTGGAAISRNMRLPGMVHARIVRPPSYGAQLIDCDPSAIEKMPGVVKVVRDAISRRGCGQEFRQSRPTNDARCGREKEGDGTTCRSRMIWTMF